VLDDEIIARAAEADAKFNKLAHTVGQNLRGAIVSAATALQDFINAFNGFEAQRTAKLDENLSALGRERLEIEREIGELRERQRQGHVGAGDGILGSSIGESLIGESIAEHQRRLDALAAEEEMILRVVSARDKAAKTPEPTATGGWSPSPYTPPPSGGGSSRDASAAAAEREAEAVRRLISDLQHEMQLVGATNLERDVANALRQAGAAATAEQRAQIVSLVTALAAEEEATRKATEAIEEMGDLGKDAMRGLIDDLVAGKDAGEAFANVLSKIGSRLIDLALNGLFSGGGIGGGGGLLGGVIIPGILHSGGVAGRDGYGHGRAVSPSVFSGAPRYHNGGIAGLKPNEVPAILEKGERVLPKGAPSMPKLRKGGDTIQNTYAPQYNIDASQAQNPEQTKQLVTAALREYDRGNYQRWLSASAQARKRNAI
jgi:hypothetical protein